MTAATIRKMKKPALERFIAGFEALLALSSPLTPEQAKQFAFAAELWNKRYNKKSTEKLK